MPNYFKIYGWLLALCSSLSLSAQSPAEFEWFDASKSPERQYTMALLRAGYEGFHLLRWQDEITDYQGNSTPAHPVLVHLDHQGKVKKSRPAPGFEPGAGRTFHWAVSNDSLVLFGYHTQDQYYAFNTRLFDLRRGDWADTEETQLWLSPPEDPEPFARSWFVRSPDGNFTALYWSDRKLFKYALLDRSLRIVYKKEVIWPSELNTIADVPEVFCSNQGDLVLYTRISPAPGRQSILFPAHPNNYRKNGESLDLPPGVLMTSNGNPLINALMLLKKDEDKFHLFYPGLGKKFISSLLFSQQGGGPIHCAGLASDEDYDRAESFFVYQIEPGSVQASLLQNTPLSPALRNAFPSCRSDGPSASPALEHLWLRQWLWTADGRPWLLAEGEHGQGEIETGEAALLRLDSTWKVNSVRRIDKYQEVKTYRGYRYSGSTALIPAGKSWWALWHKGRFPNARLMLTDCKSGGDPLAYELIGGSQLTLALLPHTQFYYQGKWYFAGDSASGDRFGVGVLSRKPKK
ncbi:MAG: hypothetical protein IT259_02855 [Saprospiraceae bacterium]|nr:hypothetical protein [Saprospiraceae bacterium]